MYANWFGTVIYYHELCGYLFYHLNTVHRTMDIQQQIILHAYAKMRWEQTKVPNKFIVKNWVVLTLYLRLVDHIHSGAVISKLNGERDITLRFIDSSLLQSVCSRTQAIPNCSPRSLYQTNQDAYENESGLSVINLNDQKLRWN